MLRIEEPDANAIGGQDRTAATERQRCSKVLGGGHDSYSGGAGDIVRSKTGEFAYDFAMEVPCNGFARHLIIF